jgi:hypothetical protein
MRPGTRAWDAAIWLLLVVNTPILITGLAVENRAVETAGLTIATVAVVMAFLDRRAQPKETR